MTPTEFDDRQPAFRIFPVAFTAATAVLVGAASRAHGLLADRAIPVVLAAVAALFAVALSLSPWRIVTVINGSSVEHTASRLVGSKVTKFEKRDVEAVELSRRFPLVVTVVLRDGRRLDALRPWGERGSFDAVKRAARPRAEALAKSLGATLRDA